MQRMFRMIVGLGVAVVVSGLVAVAAGLSSAGESRGTGVPASGVVRGEYDVRTNPQGTEILIRPVSAAAGAVGFRVQLRPEQLAPLAYRGQVEAQYREGQLVLRLPNRQGWAFVLSRAGGGETGVPETLTRVEVFGLARFLIKDPEAAGRAWTSDEGACDCPKTAEGCLAGGTGSTSCEYACPANTCSVECAAGMHACCWCRGDGWGCCKCCGPFEKGASCPAAGVSIETDASPMG